MAAPIVSVRSWWAKRLSLSRVVVSRVSKYDYNRPPNAVLTLVYTE